MRRSTAYLLLLLAAVACVVPIAKYIGPSRADPKRARECVDSGFAWLEEGEFDKAIADFTKALDFDRKMADAYQGRGAAWGRKGEHAKAIADLNEALRIDPT